MKHLLEHLATSKTPTFWSHSAIFGAISWAAKSKATFWNSFCSSFSPMEAMDKIAHIQFQNRDLGRVPQMRISMKPGQRIYDSISHTVLSLASREWHLPPSISFFDTSSPFSSSFTPKGIGWLYLPPSYSIDTLLHLFLLINPHLKK